MITRQIWKNDLRGIYFDLEAELSLQVEHGIVPSQHLIDAVRENAVSLNEALVLDAEEYSSAMALVKQAEEIR